MLKPELGNSLLKSLLKEDMMASIGIKPMLNWLHENWLHSGIDINSLIKAELIVGDFVPDKQ